MTHEQWIKMTPDEKRIKVAALCGWKNCVMRKALGVTALFGAPPSILVHANRIPDYLNDLNTMHEAEKLIPLTKWHEWISYIDRVCGVPVNGQSMTAKHLMDAYRATAAQRAEAFVMVMDKEGK